MNFSIGGEDVLLHMKALGLTVEMMCDEVQTRLRNCLPKEYVVLAMANWFAPISGGYENAEKMAEENSNFAVTGPGNRFFSCAWAAICASYVHGQCRNQRGASLFIEKNSLFLRYIEISPGPTEDTRTSRVLGVEIKLP